MRGEKLDQMKDSMFTILDEMADIDYFSIISFSSWVSHWNPRDGFIERNENEPYQATEDLKKKVIEDIMSLVASGGTNINEAVLEAIELGKKSSNMIPATTKTMIVFLTDGQATNGITNPAAITTNIKSANEALGQL